MCRPRGTVWTVHCFWGALCPFRTRSRGDLILLLGPGSCTPGCLLHQEATSLCMQCVNTGWIKCAPNHKKLAYVWSVLLIKKYFAPVAVHQDYGTKQTTLVRIVLVEKPAYMPALALLRTGLLPGALPGTQTMPEIKYLSCFLQHIECLSVYCCLPSGGCDSANQTWQQCKHHAT